MWHISVGDVAPPMNIWGTRLPLWARLFVGYPMNISDRYRPDHFPYALTAATTHLNLLSSFSCPLTSSRRTPALPTAPHACLAYRAAAAARLQRRRHRRRPPATAMPHARRCRATCPPPHIMPPQPRSHPVPGSPLTLGNFFVFSYYI
jgi:hypothetical protein